MKQFEEDLEKELATLNPAPPSLDLKSKIEQALEQSEKTAPNKLIKFWPILTIAAAACLALVTILTLSNPSGSSSSMTPVTSVHTNEESASPDFSDYEAVEAEQRLMSAIDEGIVMTTGNEPVPKLRYQFIDSVTMVNQNDGSVFRMEVPREEILLVPITLL